MSKTATDRRRNRQTSHADQQGAAPMTQEPRQDEPPSRVSLTGTQRVIALAILGAVALGILALTQSTEAVVTVVVLLLLVLGIEGSHFL
jgi:hypothetical protein